MRLRFGLACERDHHLRYRGKQWRAAQTGGKAPPRHRAAGDRGSRGAGGHRSDFALETDRGASLRLSVDLLAAEAGSGQPDHRGGRRALFRRNRLAVAMAAQPAWKTDRGAAQGRRQGDRARHHLCRAVERSGLRQGPRRSTRPRRHAGRRRDADQDAACRPDDAGGAAAGIPRRRRQAGHRLDRARQ